MNILIDYSQVILKPAGVGIYAYNLIDQLSVLDQTNTYFIVVQDDDHSLDCFENERVKLLKVKHKFFRKLSFRILLEQFYLPWAVLKYKIDVVHSLHYSFPLIRFGAQRVITIHDITFFTVPEMLITVKKHYLIWFSKLTRWFDSTLICVSQSTFNDFVRTIGVKPERCVVIPLGKSEIFKPDLNKNKIEEVKKKYGIPSDYFLFIGTIEPRKGIGNLVAAFTEFCNTNKNYGLVIVGQKGWHYEDVFNQVENSGLKEKIIFTGYIDEHEKPLLLNGCAVFVYPSLYEGFGIPVLEALACGAPVITSDISSMPEVLGNAGILINPASETELLNAITTLANDSDLRDELKRRGLVQAQKYTWLNTAQKTLKCYEEAVKQ